MRLATLTMLAAAGLAGCASRPSPMILPSGSIEVGSAVDLARVYPFDLPPLAFTLAETDGTTTAIVREFRPLPDGRTELVERDETTGTVRSRVVLSRTASGDVVIHETATPARDLLTRFDPPMLFLSAGLRPGETIEQPLRVETFTLDDPPKPKGGGDGTLTLTRTPDRAQTPNSKRSWAVLESTLRAKIGPATVETFSVYELEATGGASPGGLRGRVAERTVRVFGLVIERESETLTGINSPAAAETADTP